MNTILKYKGYEGTTEIDMQRGVCRGRILFIADLVTYESESPKGLQTEFETAVEDYLETCQELGRQPQKPLCGQFNVRTTPEIHRSAKRRAVEDGVSLNEVVIRALDYYVNQKAEVTNHHYHLVDDGNKQGLYTTSITSDTAYGVGTSVRSH